MMPAILLFGRIDFNRKVIALVVPKNNVAASTLANSAPDQTADQTDPGAAEPNEQTMLPKAVADILLNITENDLIDSDPAADAVKGGARQSGCWQHSLSRLEFFAAADSRLTKIGNAAGIQGKKMQRVKAQLVANTNLLVIKAANADDLGAYQVNRYAGGSSAWVNLFDLLAPAGLTVQTGFRERYAVAYVPKKSPLWPALVVDLSRPLERRAEPVRKKQPAPQKKEPEPGPQDSTGKTTEPAQKTAEPQMEAPAEQPTTEAK